MGQSCRRIGGKGWSLEMHRARSGTGEGPEERRIQHSSGRDGNHPTRFSRDIKGLRAKWRGREEGIRGKHPERVRWSREETSRENHRAKYWGEANDRAYQTKYIFKRSEIGTRNPERCQPEPRRRVGWGASYSSRRQWLDFTVGEFVEGKGYTVLRQK